LAESKKEHHPPLLNKKKRVCTSSSSLAFFHFAFAFVFNPLHLLLLNLFGGRHCDCGGCCIWDVQRKLLG
jgi:hypothetical protein